MLVNRRIGTLSAHRLNDADNQSHPAGLHLAETSARISRNYSAHAHRLQLCACL